MKALANLLTPTDIRVDSIVDAARNNKLREVAKWALVAERTDALSLAIEICKSLVTDGNDHYNLACEQIAGSIEMERDREQPGATLSTGSPR